MTLETAEVWDLATRQLIRALRGDRSQLQLSRWLGYRSNVVADWEGGHRAPTAQRLLQAMERVGVDVPAGFAAFHPASAPVLADGLHAWLDVLRGTTPQVRVARAAGFSRHQVRRWLSGEAHPRVPQFLGLLQALTGRSHDWVAAFVDIAQVPALRTRHRAAHAAARLVYDSPWAAAVRMLVSSDAYRADPTDDFLRAALGIDRSTLDGAIQALLDAGLAERVGGRLCSRSAFTAQATASDEDRRRLKAHWAQVARDRLDAPRSDDLVSLNLMTLSRDDLDRVRELQRRYFRELRALVAASEPEEVAAVVLMQVVSLAPEDGPTGD